jgi:hypothetical protein
MPKLKEEKLVMAQHDLPTLLLLLLLLLLLIMSHQSPFHLLQLMPALQLEPNILQLPHQAAAAATT